MDNTTGIGVSYEMSWRGRAVTAVGNSEFRSTRSPDEHDSFHRATWPLLLRVATAAVNGTSIDPATLSIDAIAWATLPADADAHGLAPLAHACLQSHREAVPEAVMQQLEALAFRHRIWHRERTTALAEILQTFDRASIDGVVLKGAALAWTIYPSPALRPMSDVDLMVPAAAARAAQLSLRKIGFFAQDGGHRRFGRNAHHLPIASRSQNGVTISVEIHRDALSRDTLCSISMSNLAEPPRPFVINGTNARMLGHIDTLRHLAHHLLEPSWNGRLRLVGVVDVFRYASIFHDQIDWQRLDASYPFVVNALRCLHHVIPLPMAFARFSPPPASPVPPRVGDTIRPLSAILTSRRPSTVLTELFNPAPWWLHAYYGVPLERSLTGVRFGRHPWRVARWLGLRASGF